MTPKRVFIVHGWGGHPEEGWFPWLARELRNRGLFVFVPAMPDSEHPRIESWVPYLGDLVGEPDAGTFFVGHSIGCQTILRYLAIAPGGEVAGGAVLVAGWTTLTDAAFASAEDRMVAGPWMSQPIDWERARARAGKFTAVFSNNDPYVSLDTAGIFGRTLGAEVVIESERGHFSGDDGVTELPSVRDAILRYAAVV